MDAKFRLGVTGGIGSGKTSVCRVFNVLGIPVFSADNEAKIIMDSDRKVAKNINAIIGRNMYLKGILDRAELAGLIFKDGNLLHKVNEIIHPLVREEFKRWEKLQESGYVVYEAAILFESGTFMMLDRVLTVVAPIEERIERVIKRNNLTREQVLERISNQSDDDYKILRSDYVINNSDNNMIIPEIIKIHTEIMHNIQRK